MTLEDVLNATSQVMEKMSYGTVLRPSWLMEGWKDYCFEAIEGRKLHRPGFFLACDLAS